ncbi:MAG TPA: hypothetical protein VLH09_13425 [Bryobacteraceae bacterium]|nr:hypothetical protein [Bryobacteraceae bacterium]
MLGVLAGRLLEKYGFPASAPRDAALGGTLAYLFNSMEDQNAGPANLPTQGPAVIPPGYYV